jgi:hypothetical protein
MPESPLAVRGCSGSVGGLGYAEYRRAVRHRNRGWIEPGLGLEVTFLVLNLWALAQVR